MGRRKKRRIKMPQLSISQGILRNIIGLVFFALGAVTLVSFFVLLFASEEEGRVLYLVNGFLQQEFGWVSIFIPFMLVLLSGHFFNSDRLKFVKPNVTVGIIVMFISLLGIFKSGLWGQKLNLFLVLDFTPIVAYLILGILFLIGLIFFLDTPIEVFVVWVMDGFKAVMNFLKDQYSSLTPSKEDLEKAKKKKEEEKAKKEAEEKKRKEKEALFISDRETSEKSGVMAEEKPKKVVKPEESGTKANSKDLSMKSMASADASTWVYPPHSLLQDIEQQAAERGDVAKNAQIIETTLDSFGIRARVADINKGPSVTQYAIEITMGTKLSKITALGNDLALALAAPTGAVRIEAPIPGRSLVGIEIPNISPEMVTMKQLMDSPIFSNNGDPLLVPLGLDVSGQPQGASIAKMPHVLIAGTTGSGKSVLLNAWLSTFLFRTRPDELRMIMVDPKRVELAMYNGVPHLLTEVIVDPPKILAALQWAVAEMENRYKEFAQVGVRNISGYNDLPDVQKKPYIVFVIDELADLMMFASKEAEDLITRIAQMARAVGIHLILATQRPSVDVITGLMKANIPTRVAFNVSSMIDSRVIIDGPGAEKLLGKGDMLFLPPDQAKPRRMQGAFIADKEVSAAVDFLKSQVPEVHYTEEITSKDVPVSSKGSVAMNGAEGGDALFNQAVEIVSQFDKASASLLQRRLKIGYARAARILDELESAGYVGPAEGSKPREVIQRQVVETE